jgi:SAM-dependent methyltransferase
MFIEEALWINEALNEVKPSESNPVIANFGSSTLYFRTVKQPHIHKYIIHPLKKKNWQIINIDIKKEEGVDVAADIADAAFGKEYSNTFSLTLCTNVLEHVENISAVVNNLLAVTKKNGYILVTVPYKYRLHYDPIDNGFRPKPAEIVSLFKKGSVNVLRSRIININDKKYYTVKKSKFFLWSHRERIKYFLGMRHKVSGILLQVIEK